MDPAGGAPGPQVQPPNLQPPPMPPPAFAAPVQPSLFRQAFRIVRNNRRTMLLPLLVTLTPVSIAAGIGFYVLFSRMFPEVPLSDSPTTIEAEWPAGLLLGLWLTNAIWWLFTLVGLAATIVAANAVIAGRPISLSASLDPAFTRMGAILGLNLICGLLAILTTVFLVFIFFAIRFGLVLHAMFIENESLMKGFGTSWNVLRGRMLRFTGMLLTFLGLCFGAAIVVALLVSIIVGPFTGDTIDRETNIVLASLLFAGAGVVGVPLGSFVITTMTLFYLRERDEKKGTGRA